MISDVMAIPKVLQVGRSEFISMALRNTSAQLKVISSQESPSNSLNDISDGMIVFVPPKLPSAEGRALFREWFSQTRRNLPCSVHVLLVSSLICASRSELDARYAKYRELKEEIEFDFSEALMSQDTEQAVSIVRMGMFVNGMFPARAHVIKTLAQALSPFASRDQEYRYTNKSTLQDTFKRAFDGPCAPVLEASATVRGMELIPPPKFLAPMVQKLYMRFDAPTVQSNLKKNQNKVF